MNLIKKIFFLILILITFEEFFFKWIPSIQIYQYALLFSDILILFSFIYYSLYIPISNKRRGFSLYFPIFIIIAIFSAIINNSFIFGLTKLWVLIRFLLLLYVINQLFDKNDFKKFLNIIYFLFLIQVFVGIVQYFNIPIINDFLQPRSDLPKMSNWVTKNEIGLAGTYTFTVYYGIFFTAFAGIIPLLKKNYLSKLFLFVVCLIFSYLSYSVISFLGVLILFITYLYLTNFKYFFAFLFFSLLIGLFLFVDNFIVYDFQKYIDESFRFSRLGIFKIIPLFFTNDFLIILFGMNLNPESLSLFIYENMWTEIPHVLYNNAAIGIEDVYWIAHLYYFGVLGLFSYLMIYISFIRSFSIYGLNKLLLKYYSIFIILSILIGFVSQIFSFKSYMIIFIFIISYIININHPRHINT